MPEMLRVISRGKGAREIRVRENVWGELASLPKTHIAEAEDLLSKIYGSELDNHFQPVSGFESGTTDIIFGTVLGEKVAVWIRKSRKYWDIINILITDVGAEARRALVALEDFFQGGFARKLIIWQESANKFGIGILHRLADKLVFEARYYRTTSPSPNGIGARGMLVASEFLSHEINL
jgi:hypothetical protein